MPNAICSLIRSNFGALFIIFYKNYWIDPLLTVLISLYILKETYEIVKESVEILMMSNPEGIDLEVIKNIVEKIPGVINIHHIHLWKLNDNEAHLRMLLKIEKEDLNMQMAEQFFLMRSQKFLLTCKQGYFELYKFYKTQSYIL